MSTRKSAWNKRWVPREQPPAAFLSATTDHTPLIATLLYQVGLNDTTSIAQFFSADIRTDLHDPMLLHGMRDATQRIATAITNRESIAVYGDFDTDGVTAVTLLMQAIGAMGGEIQPYIPNRARDGYGLNAQAVEALRASGTDLLITVDCGISNVAEVALARSLGMDVIVTDHHTPPATLPDANAIINPKLPHCSYPDKRLVGVGIAYKLVQALVRSGMDLPLRGRDLLDVVALGTVADMGPLLGENRVLVKAGLDAINQTERPGVKALISAARLRQGRVTATDIGYSLGPRLNAAGRIEDATLAYRLLLAESPQVAEQLAEQLNQLNQQRQELSQQVQEAAREQIIASGKAKQRVIVMADEQFSAGVVGLIAARLAEEFMRPTLLIERGRQLSRGSARSLPGFSIIDALQSCADLLPRFGGHSAAAGFSIPTDRIDELEARLLVYAGHHLPDTALEPMIEYNAEVGFDELTPALHREITRLEPFGQANPQPIFMTGRVHVVAARTVGSDNKHLKLQLDNGQGIRFEAMAFRLGHLIDYMKPSRTIDILYTLDMNEWNGSRTLQLTIKDLRSPQR